MIIEEQIILEMKNQGVSFTELANRTICERSHLTRCLKLTGGEKRKLSKQLKERIEEALKKQFTESGE